MSGFHDAEGVIWLERPLPAGRFTAGPWLTASLEQAALLIPGLALTAAWTEASDTTFTGSGFLLLPGPRSGAVTGSGSGPGSGSGAVTGSGPGCGPGSGTVAGLAWRADGDDLPAPMLLSGLDLFARAAAGSHAVLWGVSLSYSDTATYHPGVLDHTDGRFHHRPLPPRPPIDGVWFPEPQRRTTRFAPAVPAPAPAPGPTASPATDPAVPTALATVPASPAVAPTPVAPVPAAPAVPAVPAARAVPAVPAAVPTAVPGGRHQGVFGARALALADANPGLRAGALTALYTFAVLWDATRRPVTTAAVARHAHLAPRTVAGHLAQWTVLRRDGDGWTPTPDSPAPDGPAPDSSAPAGPDPLETVPDEHRHLVLTEAAAFLKARHCSPESVDAVLHLTKARICPACHGRGQTCSDQVETDGMISGVIRRCRVCDRSGAIPRPGPHSH
ncbi:hypothetical protein AB0D08_38275 [Kitasatospora sp. NPDC048540]|uniref:hypothetical protein n=1 Tax=Kitasatospora sp. NPDC048540 TaxID=3155634 RepID=UPI0033C0F7F9